MKLLKYIGWAFAYVKDHFGLIQDALNVAANIAHLTTSRKDDEITAAAQKYGQSVGDFLNLPEDKRWHALLDIASSFLAAKYPQIPLNRIVTAVSFAVSMLKG